MTTERDYDSEMALPAGKTCADCKHIKRCLGFGFTEPQRKSCDFHPNRFAPREGSDYQMEVAS